MTFCLDARIHNMLRALLLAAFTISALAQTGPAFEVASVKPNTSDSDSFSFDIAPDGRLAVRNMTLWNLIRYAHGLTDLQLTGGPGWIKEQGFDIQAAPPAPATRTEVLAMLRALLRERFQLRMHAETRDQPAYALVVDKNGHRLKPSTQPTPNRTKMGDFSVQKMSMKTLAQILEFDLLRPLLDRTGLTGDFAFDLEWALEQQRTAANPADPAALGRPSIFQALPEQLGLKLESITAPAPITVIDSAERPSAN